jgi:hypothetical protein
VEDLLFAMLLKIFIAIEHEGWNQTCYLIPFPCLVLSHSHHEL